MLIFFFIYLSHKLVVINNVLEIHRQVKNNNVSCADVSATSWRRYQGMNKITSSKEIRPADLRIKYVWNVVLIVTITAFSWLNSQIYSCIFVNFLKLLRTPCSEGNVVHQTFTTVFVDTRLWETKHPRKRFQNFRQSYVLSTDRIEIHQSQPLVWPSDLLYVMLVGCDWWISIWHVDNTYWGWRKFWKRFFGCFVFQSRVSTETVVRPRLNVQTDRCWGCICLFVASYFLARGLISCVAAFLFK